MSLMQTSLFYVALTVTAEGWLYERKWKLVITAVILWHIGLVVALFVHR